MLDLVADSLPAVLAATLERRYLPLIEQAGWDLATGDVDTAPILLREVLRLGRSGAAESRAIPQVLTACHDPGHSLVLAVHGDGLRHRLFLGGRRVLGRGSRSTEAYLRGVDHAFKAYYPGLVSGPLQPLDSAELPLLIRFIHSAPSLCAITGIPALRSAAPPGLQRLDRFLNAVGSEQYLLVVVAEALDQAVLDDTIDRCRRLRTAIHSSIRQTRGQTRGTSSSVSQTTYAGNGGADAQLSELLATLAVFASLAGVLAPPLQVAGGAMNLLHVGRSLDALSATSARRVDRQLRQQAEQVSRGESQSDSLSLNVLDATAEACDQLLQKYQARLAIGQGSGWWRCVSYIAAADEGAEFAVSGALRSVCSGDASVLEPLRAVPLPEHVGRTAIEYGQILGLQPSGSLPASHPLGPTFDTLASLVHSEELATLINLPSTEVSGIPMRASATFGLSVPPMSDDAIRLGQVRDTVGRDLAAVPIGAATLNRHVFVTGATGYGKTNTCMRVLLEAHAKLRVPFLIIEPAKAEYRRLLAAEGLHGQLRVFAIDADPRTSLRLNPLAAVPGFPLLRHLDLLKAVFDAAFPMFAGMSYVLEDALIEVFADRGWNLVDSDNDALPPRASLDERAALLPNLAELSAKVDVILSRKGYSSQIQRDLGAALHSRIESLLQGTKGMVLNTRRSTPAAQLFEAPAIVELQNLEYDDEKAFVIAVLFTLLYEWAEVRQTRVVPQRQGHLQHLTLIEEAHRLLRATPGGSSAETADPRGKAVETFTHMLAELRAYGEGFLVADQSPTTLVPDVLKHTGLKIVHRLPDARDRAAMGGGMVLDEHQTRQLAILEQGLAIVHDEVIGEAVQVHVDAAPNLPLRPALPAVQDQRHLFVHAGCSACPAPCRFLHRLGPLAQAGQAAAEACLDEMLLGGAAAAWAAWTTWREPVANEVPAARRVGVVFCAATQHAYAWIEQRLLRRSTAAATPTALRPSQRLQREHCARALAPLLYAWTVADRLDEAAEHAFGEVQPVLRQYLGDAPPRELAGCASCPARCYALAYVGPHLAKLESRLAPIVSQRLSPEARLLAIEQVAIAADPRLVRRAAMHCLLSNLALPAAAEADRAMLLDHLRTVAVAEPH